jgi:hypothetical protein
MLPATAHWVQQIETQITISSIFYSTTHSTLFIEFLMINFNYRSDRLLGVVHYHNIPLLRFDSPAWSSRYNHDPCVKTAENLTSDLIKAQVTPQFNWYARWTSLGANGMPDKLIKEDLKQPN